MDQLMSRSRSFAEAMVVMICPVLLALALDKVELNSKLYGRVIPALMLAIAAAALITGICPLLACCFSETGVVPNAFFFFLGQPRPAPGVVAATTTLLAVPFASGCVLVLSCWFAQLVVDRWIAIAVCSAVAICVMARTAYYHHFERNYHDLQPIDNRSSEFYDMLNQSHEFLCGVTGIFFLGLETLALQGHEEVTSKAAAGNGRMVTAAAVGLRAPMGVLIVIVCSLGVFLMLFAMIPPEPFHKDGEIAVFTLALDSIMAAATLTVLVAIVHKLMGTVAFFLPGPLLAFFVYYLFLIMTTNPGPATPATAAAAVAPTTPPPPPPPPAAAAAAAGGDDIKLASLELTRVTFTGFLAVSVAALTTGAANDSPSKLVITNMFLLFAAGAIVFGLSWRLLSQMQVRTLGPGADLASSVNLASFCAHLCIVIATVLFTVMAGIGGTAGRNRSNPGAPAPDMHLHQSHAVLSSAKMFAPANVITGFTSVILLLF